MYIMITLILLISTITACQFQYIQANKLMGDITEGNDISSTIISSVDSECGGVLEALDEVSIISYKFQKRYERYESCIWTVSAPNRTLIRLNVTHTYFNSPTDYLSIGFFDNSDYDLLNSFKWIKLDSFTEPSVEVPGPVAFIHFVSSYAFPGLGFRFTFSARDVRRNDDDDGEDDDDDNDGDNNNEKSSMQNFQYDNFFLDGEYGVFKYPPEGGPYNNNQRTTIVIKANSNLTSSTEGKPGYFSVFVNIKKVNIEDSKGCSVDNLNLYSFGHNVWYKNRTFCGSNLANDAFGFYHPRNDPIILTFKSDYSRAGNGFEFFWELFD